MPIHITTMTLSRTLREEQVQRLSKRQDSEIIPSDISVKELSDFFKQKSKPDITLEFPASAAVFRKFKACFSS